MRNKGVGGISAFEPWPNARDEQRMVLHVREGFIRVWRAEWRIP
jgi:hypothetical protein